MMFCQFRRCCAMVLLVAWMGEAGAIPAGPGPALYQQPDGSIVELELHGDEIFHWLTDLQGYPVVEAEDAHYYAVETKSGELQSTGVLAGSGDPAALGLEPYGGPSREFIQNLKRALQVKSNAPVPKGVGTARNLVVLLRFANHGDRSLPAAADYATIFNEPGGHSTLAPTGSVRDFYLRNSYEQLELNSTIVGWVNLPNTEAYYADGASGLSTRVTEALVSGLNAIDSMVDFSDFDQDNDGWIDAITFIHSGYDAAFNGDAADGSRREDRIWSHKWSIPSVWTSAENVRVQDYNINPGIWGLSGFEIGRIGVICHELGHFFGLPDLYGVGNGSGDGVGNWCAMGTGSWGFAGDQQRVGHFSAWCKIQLGWVPQRTLSYAGFYAPNPAYTHTDIYKITRGFPAGEYLLVEHRQPIGFETALPGAGLAIWHIDENSDQSSPGYPGQPNWPQNGEHYRVALLQQDGNYDLERGANRGDEFDLYRVGGNILSPSTVPNSNAYQGGNILNTNTTLDSFFTNGNQFWFQYLNGCPTPPANLTASDGAYGDRVVLSWDPVPMPGVQYRVYRDNVDIAGLISATSVADIGATATCPNTHTYKVVGVNACGEGFRSNEDTGCKSGGVISHPADTSGDGIISLSEATTFAARFANGDPTIPLNQATRFAAIFLGGGCYAASVVDPLGWVEAACP